MDWVNKRGSITKVEADNLLKGKYLLNESRNITEDLQKLTQAGLLINPKPGLWTPKQQRPQAVQGNLF